MGSGLEPAIFGFPDLPKREAGVTVGRVVLIDVRAKPITYKFIFVIYWPGGWHYIRIGQGLVGSVSG